MWFLWLSVAELPPVVPLNYYTLYCSRRHALCLDSVSSTQRQIAT